MSHVLHMSGGRHSPNWQAPAVQHVSLVFLGLVALFVIPLSSLSVQRGSQLSSVVQGVVQKKRRNTETLLMRGLCNALL